MKAKNGSEITAGCVVFDPEFKEEGQVGRVGSTVYVAFNKFDKEYTKAEAARLSIVGWEDPDDF